MAAGVRWTEEDDKTLHRELRAKALRLMVPPYSIRDAVWTAADAAALDRELFADSAPLLTSVPVPSP